MLGPDPTMARLVTEEVEKAEVGLDQVIGRATGKFARGQPDTPMGNAVCESMMEETGADFAFTNLGGIRDEFGPGPVTPRDVFQVLPFGNKLVVLEAAPQKPVDTQTTAAPRLPEQPVQQAVAQGPLAGQVEQTGFFGKNRKPQQAGPNQQQNAEFCDRT